jgi:broad specificity phosphatase PhoE
LNLLVLVPWPETSWSAAGRVAGATPLPLTKTGHEQALSWCQELAAVGLSAVYSSSEPASVETARALSRRFRARHKQMAGLAEVDAGLWDGLTTAELKRRFPKIFKRWYDDPSSVCPPEGEDVAEASERLKAALERIVGKHDDGNAAVVLGPLAFALVRCLMESASLSQLRAFMRDRPVRYSLSGGKSLADVTLVENVPTEENGVTPASELGHGERNRE